VKRTNRLELKMGLDNQFTSVLLILICSYLSQLAREWSRSLARSEGLQDHTERREFATGMYFPQSVQDDASVQPVPVPAEVPQCRAVRCANRQRLRIRAS